MKKVNEQDTLKPEYNLDELGAGVRGKYYDPNRTGGIMVEIRPEVAEVYPTAKAVNDALLSLLKSRPR